MKQEDYIKLKIQKRDAEIAYERAVAKKPFSHLLVSGAMGQLNKVDRRIIQERCLELL